MEFVTALAFSDPSHYLPMARAAEQAGFFGVALSDHVIHPEQLKTPYPYTPDGAPRWQPFTAWPDPWVASAAMAAVTERLQFLTSIYVLPMRNPFLVAKAVGTAAVFSQGRVTLGIGVGWMRDEFELCEQPFEKRGARADEMVAVLRQLWQGGWTEHHGKFYDFPRLEMSPVPKREIPIWSGGISEPALRRAANVCDGWISDLHSSNELKGYVEKLRSLRPDSPRAAVPFSVLASCNDAWNLGGYQRLSEIGVTHLTTQPWVFYGGPTDDLARKLEGIRRFGEDVIAKLA